MKAKLLASSNTEQGILQCIAAFWYSPPAAYRLEGEKVIRASNNTSINDVRVVKKGKRYRFEWVKP